VNRAECAKVLAKIQLGDNRQVDQLTLEEWFDTIGHLRFEDAVGAVRLHRQESTDYLMPAHVIRNVHRARETRLPPRAVEAGANDCRAHVGYPVPCERCKRESDDDPR
jgi:hypothetical protein